MHNESNNEHLQIQRLAALYRDKLPQEDEASLRTLAALCDRMDALQRFALPAPESDEDIAIILAVQYSLQAVLRVGRCLVIETAANSTRA